MIELMDLEYIFILMGLYIKDYGRMINNMGKDQKFGLMVQNMKVITLKVKNKVMGRFSFMMGQFIKVNLNKIIFMVLGSILGLMEKYMMDNGYKIK